METTSSYRSRLLSANTPFAVTEAFKMLRTNLMFTAGNSTPVFGVVSSFPNTGKSLISANIAIAFSMMNKKVLLIDSDMRKPVQHKCFGIHNRRGWSELLSGQTSIEAVTVPVEEYDGLHLIPSGRIPPNPQELMAAESTAAILEELKSRYDVVIVDLPPVGVVSDAMVIGKSITGYMFVVHSGESEAPALKRIIDSMKKTDCNILGMILNFVDTKTDSYSKHNYYRYNYYSDEKQ